MIIGKFQHENGVYVGSLPVFTGPSLPIRIAPTDQKGIDYKITLSGSEIELGVAWKKTSAKGNEYLSLKLDSPFLPAPVNCALFQQGEDYVLVWDRDRPKAETAAAA